MQGSRTLSAGGPVCLRPAPARPLRAAARSPEPPVSADQPGLGRGPRLRGWVWRVAHRVGVSSLCGRSTASTDPDTRRALLGLLSLRAARSSDHCLSSPHMMRSDPTAGMAGPLDARNRRCCGDDCPLSPGPLSLPHRPSIGQPSRTGGHAETPGRGRCCQR